MPASSPTGSGLEFGWRDRGPCASRRALASRASSAGIGGVVLVAREPDPEWRSASVAAVGLAGVSALGFGLFFLGLDLSAPPNPAWTIVLARVGGVSVLVVAALVLRPPIRPASGSLPFLVVIGIFDVLANSL